MANENFLIITKRRNLDFLEVMLEDKSHILMAIDLLTIIDL